METKKERNPRNQKSRKRREVQEKERESKDSAVPVVNNRGSGPQPQRTNWRQRNEPTSNATIEETTPGIAQEKKEPVEVVVDHSNLKRETEDIAKLKKKFTKRVITSNWNRYTVPECVNNEQTEDGAPADFSDLLKVPVSKGGHLQLKEEQEWSKTSGAGLGGYFALDLKLLSQSLACIPLYEQLRLPKHLLTEEEVSHFDALAAKAKTSYNPDKAKDSNSKVDEANREEYFNILDIEKRTEIMLNIEEPEKYLNKPVTQSLDDVEDVVSDSVKRVDLNIIQANTPEEVKQELPESKQNMISNFDILMKTESLESLKESPQEQLVLTETVNDGKFKDSYNNSGGKCVFDIPVIESSPLKNEKNTKGKLEKSFTENSVQHDDFNRNTINTTQLNEKLPQRNSKGKSVVNEVSSNKITHKTVDMSLEDDDDLDFLLSLNKPVPLQTNKESKPAAIKDSSFLPRGAVVTQSLAKGQPSGLDDWLDSVLQD